MIKAKAQKHAWSSAVDILLVQVDSERAVSYVTDFIVTTAENGAYVDPSFSLSLTDAQQLMDDLWNCGLRPSEGSGSAGALAATQKHLDDMRRRVFQENK